jgi:mannosyl-oligosaccharide alpha-1,2-mannosidase
VNENAATVLAELGTLHLEFYYLSDITGDQIFKQKVDKIREVMAAINKPNGLYWNYVSPKTGEFVNGKW